MGILDLRGSSDARGRVHYVIEIDNKVLLYAYIRKNGCSAFKNFFLAESPHAQRPSEGPMAFMARCHRAREPDIRSADHRVCVLRPPDARAISVFRNKFVQQAGNADIFSNYEAIVGASPQDCTFETFVNQYLAAPLADLDPHLHSQASHLLPIRYNHAVLLGDLAEAMTELLGPEIGQRHFARKANATSTHPPSEEEASTVTAAELHRRYRSTGEMPTASALCPPQLRTKLLERYEEDCRVLELYGSSPAWAS